MDLPRLDPTRFGAVAVVALVGYFVFQRLFRGAKLPLPPGPPSEFVLGHYRVVPEDASFKAYANWGKEYSA